MNRREGLLQLTAAVATLALARPPGARAAGDAASAPPPAVPANDALGIADAQRLWARLNGDLSGRTVWFTTMGNVWGFRPQADDLAVDDFARLAYGYAGVAARRMQLRPDGAIVVRQKGWAFYRNPDTGRLDDRIPNRWTGVVDTAAPMSFGGAAEQVLAPFAPTPEHPDPYAMHVRRLGDRAFVSTSSIARFKPRDTTWFKLEGSLASHHCRAADIDDASLTHVPNTYAQNLVAEWQTWTGMHGQPGHILFKGDGVPLRDPAAVPAELRAAIERFFPREWDEVVAWGR